MTPDLFERTAPADIAEAMQAGERCLRANGHDFPPELNAIGHEDERREVVKPWRSANHPNLNAWVSRYRWTSKTLRADNRVLDYLRGGWLWLGGRNVGTWLLTYCGPEQRNIERKQNGEV